MSEQLNAILPCEPGELIGIDGSDVTSISEYAGFGGKYWTIAFPGDHSVRVDKFGKWVSKPHAQMVVRRPKPKTVVKRWTFETMPIGVKVREKNDHSVMRVAVPYDESNARLLGVCTVSYAELLDEWEQLDSAPCGDVVEVVDGK